MGLVKTPEFDCKIKTTGGNLLAIPGLAEAINKSFLGSLVMNVFTPPMLLWDADSWSADARRREQALALGTEALRKKKVRRGEEGRDILNDGDGVGRSCDQRDRSVCRDESLRHNHGKQRQR
eukprot:510135-Hanusia_phi.AAC.2